MEIFHPPRQPRLIVLTPTRRQAVKKQILVVDDDQRMLDALRRAMHRQSDDWSVTFVRHPEAAWEALLETAYDAVVTDIRMPGISGLDLLERMQQSDKTKDVPVVVLTGLNDRGLKEKALERGRRRSVEQAGRRGAVDRPAPQRAADEDLSGRPAGDQRLAGRQGPAAEARSGAVADERHLPPGDGRRVPRRRHGEPRDPGGLLQPRGGGGDGDAAVVSGDAAAGGPAARHRQDRHPRQRALEARPA